MRLLASATALAVAGRRLQVEVLALASVLHLGLVTVEVGYSLYWTGLWRVPVAMAATLTMPKPLTAGMLGVLMLGERLSLAAGLGIGLILAGMVSLSVSHRPVITEVH